MPNKIILYHGSREILEKPKFGKGNKNNDYGLGFYTTPSKDLAAEWAVPSEGVNGYVNAYSIDLTNLSILDMDNEPMEHWMSIHVRNRLGSYVNIVEENQQEWLEKFPFNISGYDIIKGWRADDSYFSFVRDFFLGGLSLQKLKEAMKLGGLGIQYAVMTPKAFESLKFISPAEEIKSEIYYPKRISRDNKARKDYKDMKDKRQGSSIYQILED